MTYANPNYTSAPRPSSLDQRRFSSRKSREGFAPRPAKVQRKRPTMSYFELLMSLPARTTLPELMQVAAS